MKITERELATILAALRLWQRTWSEWLAVPPLIESIASDGGTLVPLNPEEIDGLCLRLNLGDSKVATDSKGGDNA